jgi:putative DNA primase/helicase
MCSAALQYARAGWPVFPCRERDEEYQVRGETRLRKAKAPYTGAGVKDATTDEAVITGWWKRWPNAMIGVAMGHNGLFALDFDPRVDPDTGEIFTLETLKAELEAMIGCALPVSLAAVTQSGGVHVYLKQPRDGGPEIRNRGNLPRHVDVRGIGGYVIAPPSVMTETGGRYRWLAGRQGMEPAEAPASLIEILRSKGSGKAARETRAAAPTPHSAPENGDPVNRRFSGAPSEGRGGFGDDPQDQARRRYALTALDSELKELAATPIGGGRHGGRNRGIYFAALKLGGFIPGGWLSESVVRASLLDVIRAMPNNDDPQGAEKTMENGLRDGMASPHDMSGVGTRAGTGRQQRQHAPTVPGPDPAPPEVRPRTPSAAPLSSSSQNGRVELAFAQPEGVRGRLKAAAAIWFVRLIERPLAEGDAASKGDDVRRRAFKAGLRVGAGLLDRAEVLRALDDRFAFLNGVAGSDIADGVDSGAVRDFDVGPMLTDMKCAGFPLTDLGNAERFRERHGRDFLYTTAKGWLGWDGRRYRVLNQEKDVTPAEVQAAVFETVRAIQNEAQFVGATGFQKPEIDLDREKLTAFERQALTLYEESPEDSEPMDKLLDVKAGKLVTVSSNLAKWGRASESAGRLGCIANLAKRWLTVEITDFDRNPMILNCPNGTLHFIRPVKDDDGTVLESARVELRPHDRGDLLTKLTACDYDAQAPAPEWQKFIRWAQPKRERRRYLRQWGGFNLTGEMGEQIFHIWWGPTAANGKSTAGNAMREAAGDYGDITNVETFLDEGVKKRGDQATPDIVRLPGVRFLTSGEPPKGAKINESLINSVTGGDPMLARDNFRSFFRFTPCFKWTLWCNSKPDIPQGTEGIWRRVKVLLWESHLEAHERDRTLPAKLAAEHPGILAWMVRGLIDWMDNGFVEPEDVTAQSEAYRDDSDPMASFLRLCTVEDPDGRVQSSVLYGVYCAWAKAAGEVEWRPKGFTRAMKDRGFDNKKSSAMMWEGLRLTKSVEDFVDRDGNVVAMGGNDPPAAAPQQPRPPRDFDPWREPDDDDVPY